jgi:hypothetical protein
MMSTKYLWIALALAGILLPGAAHAGRPLATDDAGTADPGTCQIESWLEREGSDRAWVLAPACGVATGLEIDADVTLPHPRDTLLAAAGLALKWVPAQWQLSTPAGDLNFGLKLGAGFEHPVGEGWQHAETSVLMLATLKPSDAVALHANVGAVKSHRDSASATLLNLALAWAPHESVLLFAETQANSRSAVFGRTVSGVGGRWWLAKDRLGVDLTASREAGAPTTRWTVGLGWYGLAL